jgi:hypothetical protein
MHLRATRPRCVESGEPNYAHILPVFNSRCDMPRSSDASGSAFQVRWFAGGVNFFTVQRLTLRNFHRGYDRYTADAVR